MTWFDVGLAGPPGVTLTIISICIIIVYCAGVTAGFLMKQSIEKDKLKAIENAKKAKKA